MRWKAKSSERWKLEEKFFDRAQGRHDGYPRRIVNSTLDVKGKNPRPENCRDAVPECVSRLCFCPTGRGVLWTG